MSNNKFRYNIALLAVGEPERYVEVAHQHFSESAQGYILGPRSLPHITICQFFGEAEPLLEGLKQIGTRHGVPPIHFSGLSFNQDPTALDLWWAALTVSRTPGLMQLHHPVLQLLRSQNVEPLTLCEDRYFPHLTLARVDRIDIQGFSNDILRECQFELVLGESDNLGQFVSVIQKL